MDKTFLNKTITATKQNVITEKEAIYFIKEYYKKANLEKLNYAIIYYRISMYLYNKDKFNLDINYLKMVHYYLFNEIMDHAGTIRTRNISKNEVCLHFRSVIYSEYDMIEDNLVYDFSEEKKKSYRRKSTDEKTVMLSKFISNIWQAHPFNDGNTRTDMVFLQKYLNKLEIDYNNKIFDNNFLYFRNALVRSNYNTIGWIEPTYEYLNKFIYNLITNKPEVLNIEETFVPEERMIIKHQ